LSIAPYNVTQEILHFYGLPFHPRVMEFIDKHTKANLHGEFSTNRDSKTTPFYWAKNLTYSDVNNIQDRCRDALRLWGYKEVKNASELLQEFNPLLTFTLV
jgi:hypothetical protein